MNLPPYHTFPIVSGDKILLRQVLSSDVPDIMDISFYDGIPATTVAQAAEMLEKIDLNYQEGDSIHWGIADKITDKIVGTCGYYRGLDKGEGELGCVLLPAFRGQGFMTAALELAIEFGRNTIELHRIFAITTLQNDKAIRLLERLDFVRKREMENDRLEYEWANITQHRGNGT